ncbi:hypothetical protein [Actinomycetospora atypica]|uniref:Uncharacterized protein n=1 Tax=Actinomycetospora atypica TaxID=1290095 RepID=A0ABV9YIZ3_9PSEU
MTTSVPAGADGTPDVRSPDVRVPDVPVAVVGWRTWRVGRRAQQRHELFSPLTGTPWPPGRPMLADCASPRHAPPGDACGCGLYAVADPGDLGWSPSDHEVLGVVSLWGEVVEGTRGWRAAQGYPRFLLTGPGISGEQRAGLTRRLGVPVYGSELPPRELAAFLAADPATADALRHGSDSAVADLLADRLPDWARRGHETRSRAAAEAARRRNQAERRAATWRTALVAWLLGVQPVALAAIAGWAVAGGVLTTPWLGVPLLVALAVLVMVSARAGLRRRTTGRRPRAVVGGRSKP